MSLATSVSIIVSSPIAESAPASSLAASVLEIRGSVGVVHNDTADRGLIGHDVDSSGWQVGAYGVYDPGPFYVKALTTYNWFDGDSNRIIDLVQFGGTFINSVEGDPLFEQVAIGLYPLGRFVRPLHPSTFT